MALGSKATFQYNPTDDDIVTYCKKKGKMPNRARNQSMIDVLPKEAKAEAIHALVEAEKTHPIQDRIVLGDASETGVVKFVEPIMNLDDTRRKYPVHTYTDKSNGQLVDCSIPFNSEIKFNMFIRNMSADNNGELMVVMKGAPERILSRCSKILVRGIELPFDAEQ